MFNTKKGFFKQKIKGVTNAIWEMEFKLSKSRLIREGVRLDRDRAKEALNNIEVALGVEKDEKKKADIQKQKAVLAEDVTRYESQMKMIDNQINGFAGDETHEPIIGILEQIKSGVELRLMYQDYISKL